MSNNIKISIIVVLVVGAGMFLTFRKKSPDTVSSSPTNTAAVVEAVTTEAPWSAGSEHLKERLDHLGLPALSAEGTVLHIHQHLDIIVHGQKITVPAGIGINVATFPQFISQIHTHDDSGMIHVESPTVQTFTLGQFFDIWGLRFSAECIGGYCTQQGGAALKIFVNGKPTDGDPRGIELAAHDAIVVTYGTDSELPSPVPASYSFPNGE